MSLNSNDSKEGVGSARDTHSQGVGEVKEASGVAADLWTVEVKCQMASICSVQKQPVSEYSPT